MISTRTGEFNDLADDECPYCFEREDELVIAHPHKFTRTDYYDDEGNIGASTGLWEYVCPSCHLVFCKGDQL